MMMKIDDVLLDSLTGQAKVSPRLRIHSDLRNSAADGSQRMLNAIEPGSVVPIHRHRGTSETVVCLRGKLVEVFYEEVVEYCREATSRTADVLRKRSLRECSRYVLCPSEGLYGIQIPAGTWHTVEVVESGTVILEVKDGAYEPVQACDIWEV